MAGHSKWANIKHRKAKEDAKRFWNFLAKVQEIRQGVRDARHQAAE